MELTGPFARLISALRRWFRRRPAGAGPNDSGEPPVGAGVPVRPKRPDPTLGASAEAALPIDPDGTA